VDAEWSVLSGADDPMVTIPWRDEGGLAEFLALSDNPALIERIAEAAAWPEMRAMLVTLNQANSPVMTSKCDIWWLSEDERELDWGTKAAGIGSYCDVSMKDEIAFASLTAQLAELQRLTRLARALPFDEMRAEFVLRPALWLARTGHATTVYVYGYGHDQASARANWGCALRAITDLVRGLPPREQRTFPIDTQRNGRIESAGE